MGVLLWWRCRIRTDVSPGGAIAPVGGGPRSLVCLGVCLAAALSALPGACAPSGPLLREVCARVVGGSGMVASVGRCAPQGVSGLPRRGLGPRV